MDRVVKKIQNRCFQSIIFDNNTFYLSQIFINSSLQSARIFFKENCNTVLTFKPLFISHYLPLLFRLLFDFNNKYCFVFITNLLRFSLGFLLFLLCSSLSLCPPCCTTLHVQITTRNKYIKCLYNQDRKIKFLIYWQEKSSLLFSNNDYRKVACVFMGNNKYFGVYCCVIFMMLRKSIIA